MAPTPLKTPYVFDCCLSHCIRSTKSSKWLEEENTCNGEGVVDRYIWIGISSTFFLQIPYCPPLVQLTHFCQVTSNLISSRTHLSVFLAVHNAYKTLLQHLHCPTFTSIYSNGEYYSVNYLDLVQCQHILALNISQLLHGSPSWSQSPCNVV